MSKLYKFGQWLGRNSLRLVLAVLVLVLGYRVLLVLRPSEGELPPPPPPPRNEVPEDKLPAAPQVSPERDRADDAASLLQNSPFTTQTGAALQEARADEASRLRVTRIVPWRGGEFRADVSVDGARATRVGVGDEVGNFRVMGIDSAAQTVEFYSNATQGTVTLSVQ